MKKIALVLLIFCVSFTFAQNHTKKAKYEKKGRLVSATYYFDNGKIEQRGFFKKGKRTGKWIQYNKQGNKVAVGYYIKGKRNGKWIFRNTNTLNEVEYLNNKIVKANHWTSKSSITILD